MEAEETRTQKVQLSKRLKGVLMIGLILFSSFLFMSVFVVKVSRAATSIYEVRNVIYINATGISVSDSNHEPTYQTLKIVIGKQMDVKGGLSTLDFNETEDTGDTAFTYTGSQQYYMFKDMNNFDDPYYQVGDLQATPNTARYVGYQFVNGTTMLMNASTWKSYFSRGMIGASIQERTLYFRSPQTYARSYCSANGYSYANVINSTYEESINYNALNTYRQQLLDTKMFIMDTGEEANISSSNLKQKNWYLGLTAVVGIICPIAGLVMLGLYTANIAGGTTSQPAPPDPPPALDPPSEEVEGLINLTQTAIERFGDSVDLALQAYLNGSITFTEYITIVNLLGAWYFGAVNVTTKSVEDILARYYNSTESMYETYAGAYETYASVFQASWTDWLTTILILIIVIVILVIIYKVVSKNVSQIPQVLVTK
ncbi:MAG: hypothetical protein EAX89_15425 [Candidatus Lokiarchaeota archaeon]|nr:hypothetical protein [Candidatus Lokiarchaeota archaeon]